MSFLTMRVLSVLVAGDGRSARLLKPRNWRCPSVISPLRAES